MQLLTPMFLLLSALITKTFAIPVASAGALEPRRYAMANLILTVYSDSNDCTGHSLGIDMEYNTDTPITVPGGIASFIVSRDLTAREQLDFSTTGPAAKLSSGYAIAPECSKFVKTVSPFPNGALVQAGPGAHPNCYIGSGEKVSFGI